MDQTSEQRKLSACPIPLHENVAVRRADFLSEVCHPVDDAVTSGSFEFIRNSSREVEQFCDSGSLGRNRSRVDSSVFPEDHQSTFSGASRATHALVPAHGPQTDIQVEQLPQRDVSDRIPTDGVVSDLDAT